MALIAWYPLNGDTNDYSGNNFHLSNSNNIHISDNGKIGKTYNFNTGKPLIYAGAIAPSNSEYENFTATAWIYPTEYPTAHGNNIFSFGGNSVIRARLQPNKKMWVLWGGNELTGYSNMESVQTVPLNKWTHVAFRLKNGKMSIYINGIKDSEVSSIKNIIMNLSSFLVGNYNAISTEAWKGCINDVRIYTHALTGKEVKELSQCKLFHYTLNENLEPRKNLCYQYPPAKKIASTVGGVNYYGTEFGQDEIGTYFVKQSTSYWWDGIGIDNIPMKTSSYYTVSFEILCEKSFSLAYDNNTTASNMTGNDAPRQEVTYPYGLTYDTPGHWKKFASVCKLKPEAENTKLHDSIAGYFPNNASMVGTKVYYRNIMVEEKDRSGEYIENEKDITLRNISDYADDLNIATSKTHNHPKFENDAYLFKSHSQITTNFNLTNNFIAMDSSQITVSAWLKPTVAPAATSYGLIMGRADYQGFGLGFSYHSDTSIKVNTYHRLSGGHTSTGYKPININEWSHVVCVLDKTISKIITYINGVKVAEAPCSTGDGTLSNKTFYIGGTQYPQGDGPWAAYQGYIKDLRIYATALSDADIKLLYQPEISIDKASVVRCAEINETDKVIQEKVHIISVGYGTYQGDYKLQIGDRLSYTYRDVQVGWTITEITKNNEIINNSFRTHGNDAGFILLKQCVEKIPTTSTILLSTYDQPAASPTASNNTNCMTWINYLRSIGSTKLSGDFAYRSSYAAVIQGGRILEEVIDNSGMNSKIILNTNIELEISQNGFNKDASISFKEFNEIPEIKSGIHNLKLGNQILPVLVDMDNDGGRWARVFYHNCKSGTVLFSSENSFAEAKETNINAPTTSDKYSILSKLESFRPNTNSLFEFKLKYPTDTNDSNIWKQTSNPTYKKVTGYTPVKINWTSNYWGGLEWTNGSTTLINGSVNIDNWFYAIGASIKHGDGIPSCTNVNNNGSTANDVELWVRINNYDLFADNLIKNVSISRDGILTAKEFREI